MQIHKALLQARGLVDSGRHPDAIEVLKGLAHQHPDFPDVHNQLGIALSLSGDQVMAEAHLKRALELNPDYAEAHLNLAILLFERRAYSSARDHLRQFTRIVRGSEFGYPEVALNDLAQRHAALAEQYRSYGLLEEAQSQLQQALRLRPAYCDLRLQLARVLFEQGKLEESATEVEAVMEQRPHYDEALLLRGRIEHRRGRLEAARIALAQVKAGAAAVQARALLEGLPESPRTSGTAAHLWRPSAAGGGS